MCRRPSFGHFDSFLDWNALKAPCALPIVSSSVSSRLRLCAKRKAQLPVLRPRRRPPTRPRRPRVRSSSYLRAGSLRGLVDFSACRRQSRTRTSFFLEETVDDAAAAVAQAWSADKPGFQRPLKNTLPQPDKEGWTETKVFTYETSPNERAVVVAIAQRAAGTWTVVLMDGKEPTFEKRGAQLGLMLGSLRPKDYQRKMFTGRKANELTPERVEELRALMEASMKRPQTSTPKWQRNAQDSFFLQTKAKLASWHPTTATPHSAPLTLGDRVQTRSSPWTH